MAKKKAPVLKSQVLPNPKSVKVGISFDDLAEGEYFIMDGELWQVSDQSETCQGAQNALTGEIRDDLCDEVVIPVIVNLNWEIK